MAAAAARACSMCATPGFDGGAEEETYVYSTSLSYSDKYSRRIIKRSYDWVKYLANHAYTVHRR